MSDRFEHRTSTPRAIEGLRRSTPVLDSADHKSHLAYPRNNACPSSHPVAIPVVSYHLLYRVKDSTKTSAWRLSSDTYDTGKPGGFSVHGDWFGAWDDTIMERRTSVRRTSTFTIRTA